MDVLRGPGIGNFEIERWGDGEIEAGTGLPDSVGTYNLIVLIVVVPVNGTIIGNIIIE